jgi:hypothetical protein
MLSLSEEKEFRGVAMKHKTKQHRTQRRLVNNLGQLHHRKGIMRVKLGASTLH